MDAVNTTPAIWLRRRIVRYGATQKPPINGRYSVGYRGKLPKVCASDWNSTTLAMTPSATSITARTDALVNNIDDRLHGWTSSEASVRFVNSWAMTCAPSASDPAMYANMPSGNSECIPVPRSTGSAPMVKAVAAHTRSSARNSFDASAVNGACRAEAEGWPFMPSHHAVEGSS